MTDGMTERARDGAVDFTNGICLALPGAASHIATVAGGALEIEAYLAMKRAHGMRGARIKATVGVSAGTGPCAAVSFGVLEKLPRILREWMQDNRILDIVPDGKLGLCAWRRIPELVDELLGKGVELGEAQIPLAILVTDADAAARGDECVVVLSSWATPRVKVSEAIRAAMALVPLAPMVPIPSLGTELTPDIRLFFDCGFSKNVPDDVYDSRPEPTIACSVRQRPTLTGKPIRVTADNGLAQAAAVIGAVTRAPDRPSTRRTDGLHIVLDAVGSGLDFDLTPEETTQRITNGRRSVSAALARMEAP